MLKLPSQHCRVYHYRAVGRDYCQTEGSEHYMADALEPIDLMIAQGVHEGFFIGNILKYASRFRHTRNLDDLKKVSDYAHLLCGVELENQQLQEVLKNGGEPIPGSSI